MRSNPLHARRDAFRAALDKLILKHTIEAEHHDLEALASILEAKRYDLTKHADELRKQVAQAQASKKGGR